MKFGILNLINILTINAILNFSNFALNIIFIRMIGPSLVGEYAFLTMVSIYTTVYFTSQFNWLYLKTDRNQISFNNLIELAIMYSAINGVFVTAGIIYYLYTLSYQGIIYSLLTIIQILTIYVTLYQGQLEDKFEIGKIIKLYGILSCTSTLICIILMKYDVTIYIFVIKELIPLAIMMIYFYKKSKYKYTKEYRFKEAKELFWIAVKLNNLNVTEKLFYKLPFVIYGNISKSIDFGNMVQSFTYGNLPNVLLSPLTEKILYSMGVNKNKNEINKYINKTLIISCMSIIVGITAFYIYGEIIIKLVLGEEWLLLYENLRFLTLYIIILPILNTYKTILIAKNKNKQVIIGYGVGCLAITIMVIMLNLMKLSLYYIIIPYTIAVFVMTIYFINEYKNE